MSDCLFCRIAEKTLPASIVYENDRLLAFNDIAGQAPTHLLIIPKTHIAGLQDLAATHQNLIGEMTLVATEIAKTLGVAEAGYRLVMNCNEAGGQTVFHLHMHLLAGRQMTWPPG